MLHPFSRTELLIGPSGIERLKKAHVVVFGIGGVGSFTAEALIRSGLGTITIIDDDTVNLTNLNRQLIALHSTLDQPKVEVMKKRLLDINPAATVHAVQCFYNACTYDTIDLSQYDYAVDAIDTITSKLELVVRCEKLGLPLISSMGAGNKLDPTRFEIADIYKTSVCPVAKVMRKECKTLRIKKLKVVYSKEEPKNTYEIDVSEPNAAHRKRQTPGSIAFVPSVVGLIIASEVVKDLLQGIDI